VVNGPIPGGEVSHGISGSEVVGKDERKIPWLGIQDLKKKKSFDREATRKSVLNFGTTGLPRPPPSLEVAERKIFLPRAILMLRRGYGKVPDSGGLRNDRIAGPAIRPKSGRNLFHSFPEL
jgi:hypothetical protein